MDTLEKAICLRKQNLTTVEIGAKLGKSPQTIWRWLKKAGVFKSFRERKGKEHHAWKGGCRSYITQLAQKSLDEQELQSHACWRCDYTKGNGNRLNIHHIDRDRRNNNFLNLEVLCTSCHRKEHANNDLKHGSSKIDRNIAKQIRQEYSNGGVSYKNIAEKYSLNRSYISDIINNRAWRV